MSAPGKRAGARHAIRTLCLLVACSLAASVFLGQMAGAADMGAAAKRSPMITVKGNATGLYPGGSAPLRVRVRNRGPQSLVIRKIKVRAGAPGAACSGSNLSVVVPKRLGTIRLRPRSSAKTTLALRMLASAPDACQGARIPLRFKVRARRP